MLEEGDFVDHREDLLNTEKPKIARACPVRVKLRKGDVVLYCTCGFSKYQPFCDGAHKELTNNFKPLKVTVTKDQKYHLWCACKRNKLSAGPNCDGTHSHIDDW